MFTTSDTVLEVDKISKLYARRPKSTRIRVWSILFRAMSGLDYKPVSVLYEHEFWAVHNVSFSLRRGESVGIIGLNGSGKTTLLRMLAGQILPDGGEIRILGRSAAMIDLTAGFQISESGLANIFLRGAALGRNIAEIEEGLDDIIDFTELGDTINAPVETYSAGMTMRLAFSIMLAATPDILFIDEILAVGDFRFRQKCLARLREIHDKSAFVLVSHNMTDISRFCNRVLVLDKGNKIFEGEPESAIAHYTNLELDPRSNGNQTKQKAHQVLEIYREDMIKDINYYWSNEFGEEISVVNEGDSLILEIYFKLLYKPSRLIIGIPIYNQKSELICAFSSDGVIDIPYRNRGKTHLRLSIPNIELNPGHYEAPIGIVDGVEFLYRNQLPDFIVKSTGRLTWGSVTIPHTWSAPD